MATPCDSTFEACVADPLSDSAVNAHTALSRFGNLNSSLNFTVNLIMYILYAVLIVMIGYNLFQVIYNLVASPTEEVMKRFKQGIINAVFAAVGIILLLSARFILVTVANLLGIPAVENVFSGENPLTVTP